ncbi:Gp37Gp68 family protein [Paramagnetospirillum caucaseum]|uniref:Gp37Gp68 family protein n=1 Tax=Paramagnetospirillum caucaseum TaxID=1244869 RepID=M2YEL0_9PROT|nr:phage Gp37/Gp68 family protein [Paramagnetospirillum caucaseum]EME71421.1 Gp37Gp68 family protein [Paramagnetospirillum caucaseum]
MADRTKIEWTDATWNALRGCSKVSAGCTNCYAEGMAGRFSDPGQWGYGIATREPESLERYILRGRWTGKVVLDEKALFKPLHWKKPRRIFVTSIGDPFHPAVTDDMLDRLFAVMALAPQHTFQLLTKRPERMRAYLDGAATPIRIASASVSMAVGDLRWSNPCGTDGWWPLPNVWLGVSVENQPAANERIPHLLATPATMRFLSCEPLLGPLDLERWLRIDWQCQGCKGFFRGRHRKICPDCGREEFWSGSHAFNGRSMKPNPVVPPQGGRGIDWVIVGGESGPKARPMHPDWAIALRDQCSAAGVPFFFKQWGEWGPYDEDHCPATADIDPYDADERGIWMTPDGGRANFGTRFNRNAQMIRIGKKAAGRRIDGREHLDVPMDR